uniref:Serine/threonine-protein phosphatase n=1 Tax=Astyanax mexicanus TaxID=7994 RepID=A0A8B9M0W9_ASTMX
MRAALLIQRWYRQYVARLEMRRRCTWNIFQSIEYSGEQDQIKVSQQTNYKESHMLKNGQQEESEVFQDAEWEPYFCYKSIDVPDMYTGPHLTFPLTVNIITELVEAFKHKQHLHARYVLQLLGETWRLLRILPNINEVSTFHSKEITICGDLHGQLEDLLLVFYKNGLPSVETPYVFNGDFVDRGKDSIEILLILFAFQLVYPNDVHLNRGNHEDHIVNLRYGFTKEVLGKYRVHGKKILKLLQKIFSWLPLATVIDQKVLILHGGISDTTDLKLIAKLERNRVSSLTLFLQSNLRKKNKHLNHSKRTNKHINLFLCSGLQIVDMLWSDPMSQDGCIPNEVRGGGCYWGPDITEDVLNRHNLRLLIRSHECKQDGYEFCHNRRVLTIFSASNYYEVGSNRGAYIRLGPDLNPHVVQYQASRSTRELTLRQSVGRTERSALRALREQVFAHKSDLTSAYEEFDPEHTGVISMKHWAVATETVLQLGLPWRVLREQLVGDSTQDGIINYNDWFRELALMDPNTELAHTGLLETMYRHHSNLETIFRIIDTDHSGLISFEEFRQTWKLLSSHLKMEISDKAISDLALSIDFNKDGSIDINEFMEAFRLVDCSHAQILISMNGGTSPDPPQPSSPS